MSPQDTTQRLCLTNQMYVFGLTLVVHFDKDPINEKIQLTY